MLRILAMLLMVISLVAGGAFTQVHAMSQSSSSSSVSGQIMGDQTAQYSMAAMADQQVSIKMTTNNSSNYFNVEKKGSAEAICQGSMTGNICMFRPQDSADYVIKVFLMPNAARRGEQAQYTLSIEQSASGSGLAQSQTQLAPAESHISSAVVAACKSALALKSGMNEVFVLPLSHAAIPGGNEVFLMLQGVHWLCMTDSRGNVNRLEPR